MQTLNRYVPPRLPGRVLQGPLRRHLLGSRESTARAALERRLRILVLPLQRRHEGR